MFEVEFEVPGEKTGELNFLSPISLIVDGRNIDNYYSNSDLRIETIEIYGRQTNNFDIQTTTPAKYDGEMVLSKRMSAKTINVMLFIESKEFSLIQAFISDLNTRLKNAKRISFKDEPGLSYYVEFEGADNPDESLRQELSLDFFWYDPIKYKDEQTIQYTNAQRISVDSSEPVQPYIELRFASGVKQWSMRNTTTDCNINYEHELISDRYQIDVEEQRITKGSNQIDAMDGLKLEFGFEEFDIKNGDQIVVTPTPQSINIKYRGVSL